MKIIVNIRVKEDVVLPVNRKSAVSNAVSLRLLFLALLFIEISTMRRVCNDIAPAIFVRVIFVVLSVARNSTSLI